MKKIINLAAIAGLFFTSCQNFVKNEDDNNLDSLSAYEAHASRDMSITAENAYSDLFLDSTAVEAYISKEALSDTLARALRGFYNTRNFQYAWFSSNGLTEQGRSFWYLYEYNDKEKKEDDSLARMMDTLMMEDSFMLSKSGSAFQWLELDLTKEFVEYRQQNRDAQFASMGHPVPVKKMDVMQLADSILNKKKDTAAFAKNKAYTALKQHLATYHKLAQDGGWQPLKINVQPIRKGAKSPDVVALKKRMQLTDDYGNDTTNIYNDSLEAAIRSYQQRNGLAATGMVNDSLIQSLNVPVEQRLEQILINLNRMAWTPHLGDSSSNGNYITVNVPQYMLFVYEGDKKSFDMPVIVGKEGTNTMMFTGNLNQLVFSPYWNLPQSIVENEIMAAMKQDPAYLKKRNMEIVKQNDSIPQIRQLPGKDNALGKVKFLFPNSFDIYLHDTPNKELFNKNDRALSHGCIRVANAAKLAEYLLKDQKEWTPEKIQVAMNSGKEQTVKLNSSIPVLITYYTAWTDENGHLHFGQDVYGHDAKTAAMLFTSSRLSNHPGTMPGMTDSINKKVDTTAKRKAA